MQPMDKLAEIRRSTGRRITSGLGDEAVQLLIKSFPDLTKAISNAYQSMPELSREFGDDLNLPEDELICKIQSSYINFYEQDAINPYVAIAAQGPWIITSKGAVLHDSGGYGMLGLGHTPAKVLSAMSKEYVMANIMTASFSQARLIAKLRSEIGHSRSGGIRHPFSKFLCLNSGSEAVGMALRFSDINAKIRTDPGGSDSGKTIKCLSMKGSFHGRTDRPAQVSDSSLRRYRESLASFRDRDNLLTVTINDTKALAASFEQASRDNVFIEAVFIEPVMGEGNPGEAVSREFYDLARTLTRRHSSLLVVDSIQAALRAHGCLSICDYPGFSDCEPPDLETYSKALNAGQYPLSVLAMAEDAAALYCKGIYGNTMTTNPRALEVACAVLDEVDEGFRKQIAWASREFIEGLLKLQKEFPKIITDVKGTGLLCAAHINPDCAKVVGPKCLEYQMRTHGIGVIHGGKNALRFTPHFQISKEEINLVMNVMREIFKNI